MKLEIRLNKFYFTCGIPLINKTFTLSSLISNRINTEVLGYGSRTKSGRHVLFFDYDSNKGLTLEEISNELNYLQDKYKLSEFYFFKCSEGSYHIVCLDSFSLFEAWTIIKESSCDYAFKNAVKFYQGRQWILRIGTKGERNPPKFIGYLKSKYDEHIISNAHQRTLINYFKAPEIKHKQTDKLKEHSFIKYFTGSRVKKGNLQKIIKVI